MWPTLSTRYQTIIQSFFSLSLAFVSFNGPIQHEQTGRKSKKELMNESISQSNQLRRNCLSCCLPRKESRPNAICLFIRREQRNRESRTSREREKVIDETKTTQGLPFLPPKRHV